MSSDYHLSWMLLEQSGLSQAEDVVANLALVSQFKNMATLFEEGVGVANTLYIIEKHRNNTKEKWWCNAGVGCFHCPNQMFRRQMPWRH